MTDSNFSNNAWYERAKKSLVGGVSSPVRSFNAVGGTPLTITEGNGAHIKDVEGRTYLDYIQSYGASILGHAHPKVVEAIQQAASKGTTFGATTPGEIELAERIKDRVKGLELIRFVSSGTEATMSAIRTARGATGKSKIIIFSGCYHGHSDYLLASGGSGIASLAIPSTKGVPTSYTQHTVIANYNEIPIIDNDTAAVIVEPVAANMGLVEPQSGFLSELRKVCDNVGALLIFDEVITGFRVNKGGASTLYGVRPDLWCFGKIIGGGLPLAAFGGRADVMEELAPVGKVYQAGTLSGNPVATAAGSAVLDLLSDESYESLKSKATKLSSGLRQVIGQRGIAASITQVETLLGIHFSGNPVKNFEEAQKAANNGKYKQFFHGMLKDFISFAPGPYESIFISLAHSDSDLNKTVEAADATAFKMSKTEFLTY